MQRPEPDVSVRGDVTDEVGATHRVRDSIRVEDITAYDTNTPGLKRAGQKLIASGGKVVEDDDFVTVLQKAIRQVAADKTGPSGDECLHAGRV